MTRLVVATLLAAPLLLGGVAAAEPCVEAPCHFQSASTIKTDGGSEVRLPPGYFVSEANWAALDAETRRLQDAETRLATENTTLRAEAERLPFGWGTVVALGLAFAAGGAAALWAL